jgi:hypothetical protein
LPPQDIVGVFFDILIIKKCGKKALTRQNHDDIIYKLSQEKAAGTLKI